MFLVEAFRLEVYDTNLITLRDYDKFFSFLLDIQRSKLEEFVVKGSINREWLDFREWFVANVGTKLIWRGISPYTYLSLLKLRKYGNDRYALEACPGMNAYIKATYGLEPEQFVWGCRYAYKAFEHLGDKSECLFCLYDAGKLVLVGDLPDAWKLAPGITSFREALSAIVTIKFKL